MGVRIGAHFTLTSLGAIVREFFIKKFVKKASHIFNLKNGVLAQTVEKYRPNVTVINVLILQMLNYLKKNQSSDLLTIYKYQYLLYYKNELFLCLSYKLKLVCVIIRRTIMIYSRQTNIVSST